MIVSMFMLCWLSATASAMLEALVCTKTEGEHPMRTKRFISALLALVMILSLAAPAFATGEEGSQPAADPTDQIVENLSCAVHGKPSV